MTKIMREWARNREYHKFTALKSPYFFPLLYALAHRPLHFSEIMQILNLHRERVNHVLHTLMNLGLVRKDGGKRTAPYRLTLEISLSEVAPWLPDGVKEKIDAALKKHANGASSSLTPEFFESRIRELLAWGQVEDARRVMARYRTAYPQRATAFAEEVRV